MERLKRCFADEAAVVEAHINNATRKEVVKWTVESFQSFLNELKDIKVLLKDESHCAMINSLGAIKGIVARLPKRTRDKLTEHLGKSNQHLPDFEGLLRFVEEQLKLISHLIMNIVNQTPETKFRDVNVSQKVEQSVYKTPSGRKPGSARSIGRLT